MFQSKLFKISVLLLALVAVLDLGAIWLHLYWTIGWFDSVVHFFGGACVGMTSVWLFVSHGPASADQSALSRKNLVLSAVIGALVIGILWEIFELTFDITFLSDGMKYYSDTASDLVMDVLGATVSSFFAYRIIHK